MPPKKRKLDEEPPKKKMTAKEKRELMERARQSMMKDAEAKGIKSTAKRRRISSSTVDKQSSSSSTTATSPLRKSTSTATNTRRESSSSVPTRKSKDIKQEKRIPISARKSRKQKLKEGRERATAWNAGLGKKSTAKVKEEKTEEEEDIEDDESMDNAGVEADNKEEQKAEDEHKEDAPPPPVESPEREERAVGSSENLSTKNKKQSQFEGRARAAAWAKEDKRTKTVDSSTKETQPSYGNSNYIPEETRKRPVLETPPHVISPMENRAKRTEIKEEITNQHFDTTNAVIEGANEELIGGEHEEHDIKSFSYVKVLRNILLLLGGLGLTGATLAFLNYDHDFEFNLSIAKDLMPRVVRGRGIGPPCFLDSAEVDSTSARHDIPKSLLEKGIKSCQGDPIPCPDLAACSGGYLRSCLDHRHFEVSEGMDDCVLTKSTLELIDKLESSLANLTVEHICDSDGSDLAVDVGGIAPMFRTENITDFPQDDHTIVLVLSYAVRTSSLRLDQTSDGEIILGLSDDYVTSRLPYPFDCWIKMVALNLISFLWNQVIVHLFWFLINVIKFVATTTMKYPLASFAAFCFLWIIRTVRLARRSRRRVRMDAVKVREVAYDKLQHQAQEYAVLHLRDEVAHELYPSSKKQRAYIIKEVWPRVISDVKQDNRISKSCVLMQGKPRDVWTWVAPKTPKRKIS
eukprot:CAMPEP_0195296444 /NCGR_PEP_ID=MMETSP0707-20130614/19483_1 /TAXON_ID=33640 /ORGANISM="Asterionellopsis glacialis, Strain CCMP134" /LENGTH=688 /DNA_ID=CAMNT_0040357961 /DNA_START=39 /DNA_END=2105 /DNA_ORIENTATION=+